MADSRKSDEWDWAKGKHAPDELDEFRKEMEAMPDTEVELRVELTALRSQVAALQQDKINMTSTIEGLKNLDAITCGCRYGKVWGGTKWEHYFVPCKSHDFKALSAQLKSVALDPHTALGLECSIDDEGDYIVKLRGIEKWHLAAHGDSYKAALILLAEFITMAAQEEAALTDSAETKG